MQLFDIIAIGERNGLRVKCNADPLTHDAACEMLKRFSHHPARRIMLVPHVPA